MCCMLVMSSVQIKQIPLMNAQQAIERLQLTAANLADEQILFMKLDLCLKNIAKFVSLGTTQVMSH